MGEWCRSASRENLEALQWSSIGALGASDLGSNHSLEKWLKWKSQFPHKNLILFF